MTHRIHVLSTMAILGGALLLAGCASATTTTSTDDPIVTSTTGDDVLESADTDDHDTDTDTETDDTETYDIGADSPEDAVEDFFDATSDRDELAMCHVITLPGEAPFAATEGGIDECTATFETTRDESVTDEGIDELELTTTVLQESGDTATVEARVQQGDDTAGATTTEVPVVRHDGRWYVIMQKE